MKAISRSPLCLQAMEPLGSYRTWSRTRSRNAAEALIRPGTLAASMRAAVFTVSPQKS